MCKHEHKALHCDMCTDAQCKGMKLGIAGLCHVRANKMQDGLHSMESSFVFFCTNANNLHVYEL